MSVIFSPINKSQIHEVLDFWKIHAENHSRPFDSVDLVSQLIDRDPDALIVAINEGKIVGTVIAGWDGWRGSIYRLAVDGNLKGQGLGRQLMEKAEERLKTLGATRVNAVVYEENSAAHSFYQRLGYSKQLEWARWVKDLQKGIFVKEVAQKYLEATNVFLNIVASLTTEQMSMKNADGWTPRHFIHHLADSEAQSYARLRRLIAEPGTTIQGYDENVWANNSTLGYSSHDIDSALAVYKSVRQASYELLLRMDEALLTNRGTHTESGEYTVADWIRSYTNHPIDHANQIKEILGH